MPRLKDLLRLQWGRDLSAAEGKEGAELKIRHMCFNGAATFRPRKAGTHRRAQP